MGIKDAWKRRQIEKAKRILMEAGELPPQGNGISEEQFNALKREGIIREEEGASILYIPEEECRKIPGATVIGRGEDKACLLRYYRRSDGVAVTKELKIIED